MHTHGYTHTSTCAHTNKMDRYHSKLVGFDHRQLTKWLSLFQAKDTNNQDKFASFKHKEREKNFLENLL